jgi:hypothetical protein
MKPLRKFIPHAKSNNKPLTRKDMYNEKGECILPIITPKKWQDRSKY